MSLPYPWQGEVEDWGHYFEEKYGRYPTRQETEAFIEGLTEGKIRGLKLAKQINEGSKDEQHTSRIFL